MNGLAASPIRNLTSIVAFVVAVMALATIGYMRAGWSFEDAISTRWCTAHRFHGGLPRSPPDRHDLSSCDHHGHHIVLGCTGMILFPGAVVQVFTSLQIKQLLGLNRVRTDIDKLKGHVIVCGFGRIGFMLARDLAAGGADFLILELRDKRFQEALDLGYLALQVDATSETALTARRGRARQGAGDRCCPTTRPTCSSHSAPRSLNPDLHIIPARAEAPVDKEQRLIQASADQVVLPTHIGAERIAELILYPA